MITGEDEARRRREAEREKLIERLNAEEQPPGREEVEERERRAEEIILKEGHGWLFLAAFSSVTVVFGLFIEAETYYVWLGPIGLWLGPCLDARRVPLPEVGEIRCEIHPGGVVRRVGGHGVRNPLPGWRANLSATLPAQQRIRHG